MNHSTSEAANNNHIMYQEALQRYRRLPNNIKRRVRALKNVQREYFTEEAEFFRRLNELEREFNDRFQPILDKRFQVISGDHEPTDAEAALTFDDHWEEIVNEEAEMGDRGDQEAPIQAPDSDAPGIPEFWLTVFKNSTQLSEHTEKTDEPILRHLTDIRIKLSRATERPSFTLEFHFSPNEHFTNSVLTKQYFIRFHPIEEDPMAFDGPEIVQAKGCTINWNPGKNITIKVVKKAMKQRNKPEKKSVSKTVKTSSFFNFFDPPTISMDDVMMNEDDVDDELEAKLQSDFELGQYLREMVVPRAILLFTGEALDDDNEDEDFDEAESDEEDGTDNQTSADTASSARPL